ncbi:MAG: SDR family NAD(P)-dependent oxidoreductase [Chloroflexi bacterium]|nr:SDR family NAD(P)-dependent oxidoreductase [Chloroflexota bacterium]
MEGMVTMQVGYWAGRRVFVTGASGFLGSHLVRRLVGLGGHVFAFLRPASETQRIADVIDRVTLVEGDLFDVKSLERGVAVARPELVYHLAAAGVAPDCDDEQLVRVNAMGTLQLLRACAGSGLLRFVYAGSCFEYGEGSDLAESQPLAPTSVYAASKLAGHAITQAFCHRHSLPWVSLRPFTVYGPWERTSRLIPHTIFRGLKGEDVLVTPGEQERDYIFVDDVIDGFLLGGEHPAAIGRTFNLCTGQPVKVRDIVCQVLDLLDSRSRPVFGALPYRADEMFRQSGDNRLARSVLGWAARYSLLEGLRLTIEWYKGIACLGEQGGEMVRPCRE